MDPMRNDLPSGCFSWDLRQAFVSLGSADSTTPWCAVSGIRTPRIFSAGQKEVNWIYFALARKWTCHMAPWQGLRDDCFFKRAKCVYKSLFSGGIPKQLLVPEILGGSLETGFCWGTQFLL
jgi:hypothetical protein